MSYWRAGHQLQQGKYIIEQVLGGGGFGVTYRAQNQPSRKLVAIKTLNATIQAQPDFAQHQTRFIQEAFRLAKCSHPHVIRVDDVCQEGELWCMVMEYIPGENLNEYVERQGVLSSDEALRYIQQIGEALSYIHQQGFLHRDVKPHNIMLRQDTAVLIDFGLAREFVEDRTQTHTNAITRSFAPPEQYEQRAKRGAYTDIYALAATLYYLLTAELPLDAQFRKYAPEEFIPPKQHNPQISNRVNEAILKGMALEPKDRPSSVQQWLELLAPIGVYQRSSAVQNIPRLPDGSSLSMQVFEFDVVTVNARGQRIKREKGRSQYFSENLRKVIILLSNGVTLDMVAIPGGEFIMGSPEGEGSSDERPQHKVRVPPFFMGKYQVTQAQWNQIASLPKVNRDLKLDPSHFRGDNLPVERVSWNDAVEFCQRLSNKTGRQYRLPSEAEWEYACRARTTTPFHFGETITAISANYRGTTTYANEPKGKYRKETTPVGSFPPNAFGLYDMHGNVCEWCADYWHKNYKGAPNDGTAWLDNDNDNDYRLIRGGSWVLDPWYCRSACRDNSSRVDRYDNIGFRLCVAHKTT